MTLTAPETVFFSHDTVIGNDVEVEPFVVFAPGVTVKSGARIRSHSHLEGAVVGVGTVLDGQQLEAARQAGARFAVSPGVSPKLLDAADASALPLLPGVATAGEAMSLLERGYKHLKLFPAVPVGGAKLLAAWASPLPRIRFCPTGGISLASAPDFLALPNVACVGDSWLTPKDKLQAGDWASIEQLAREAAALR